jgi:hypothetical protein
VLTDEVNHYRFRYSVHEHCCGPPRNSTLEGVISALERADGMQAPTTYQCLQHCHLCVGASNDTQPNIEDSVWATDVGAGRVPLRTRTTRSEQQSTANRGVQKHQRFNLHCPPPLQSSRPFQQLRHSDGISWHGHAEPLSCQEQYARDASSDLSRSPWADASALDTNVCQNTSSSPYLTSRGGIGTQHRA